MTSIGDLRPGCVERRRRGRVGALTLLCCSIRCLSGVLLCLLLGMVVIGSVPALAISQRGHVFSFSYGSKGGGDGQFSDPTGVAVNDSSGDLYVADHKNKRIVQLEPVTESGRLVGERYLSAFAVPSQPEGVAVDNSALNSDESRGDVYVVSAGGKAIYKFSPEGALLGELKKFTLGGMETRFDAIRGIAVDAAGSLFVYQEDGKIFRFNDVISNGEGELVLEAGVTGVPGFALDSEDNFFVGILGEEGFPVVTKLEGITGTALCAALDDERTTAVAVNTIDVPSNEVNELNDVYLTNVTEESGKQQTVVAQFAPSGACGRPVQRFPPSGLPGEETSVAVDDETGAVYVTDAATDDVVAFSLEPPGVPVVTTPSVQSTIPPAVDARWLTAQVDPTGAVTSYHFEYGELSCADAIPDTCTDTPTKETSAEFGDVPASQELEHLTPGVYHYRLIATDEFGTVASPERSFTIFGLPSGLPDGRSWEMVTPPDKHGAAVEALTHEGGLILAAEDGDALTYVTNGAITEDAEGNRSFEQQQALSTRGASDWNTKDIATPQNEAQGIREGGAGEYQFFSPDLALALVEPFDEKLPLAPGVAEVTTYLRDDQPVEPQGETETQLYRQAQENGAKMNPSNPGYLPVTTAGSFVDATPDLSHVVLNSAAGQLYEWSASTSQLVSEMPDHTQALTATLGGGHVQAHAISEDGTRIVWTDSVGPGHLYMRDTATNKTIMLDAVRGLSEAEQPPGEAQFQTASRDGTRVFFTDTQALTERSTAAPEEADLYECEVLEEQGELVCDLSDLTGEGLGPKEHAAVQRLILGASEDGSIVYLVALGVLASNENESGERAEMGHDNLYELRDTGPKWVTTFIATLSSEDGPDWDENNQVASNTAFQTARVAPNGRYLAFMSNSSLTGFDNEDVSSKHPREALDEEVYLYDAANASLTCVSCNPTGAQPEGVYDTERSGEGTGLLVDRRGIWSERWLSGSIPGWTPQSKTNALFQSRYLSNEGRLFFDSADVLVPGVTVPKRNEEVKGKMQPVGVENVYEYEPAGVGGCEASDIGGCVALISSGTSSNESAFMEATPSGGDVFFLTTAQLLPQDTDDAFDIYDARVCTPRSPCLPPTPPTPSGCDSAATCHSPSSSEQLTLAPSGSATFSGPGDVIESLAAHEVKGEVKGIHEEKAKPLTQAQKLAKALQACKRAHPHSRQKRLACEARARKLYGSRRKAGAKASRPSVSQRGRR